MIHKLILGTLLLGAVVSPLNAMQTLQRARIGARSLGQVAKVNQPMVQQVPCVIPSMAQQTAVLSTLNQQQQSQNSSRFNNKHLLAGLTGLGIGYGLKEKVKAEGKSDEGEVKSDQEIKTPICMAEFNRLSESEQIHFLVTCWKKDYLSWKDWFIIQVVFTNKDLSKEVKDSFISQCITKKDFLDFNKNYLCFLPCIIEAFSLLEGEKQLEIFTTLCNKRKSLRNLLYGEYGFYNSFAECMFLEEAYVVSSEQVKKNLIALYSKEVDFETLSCRTSLPFSDEVIVATFATLDEEEQIKILIRWYDEGVFEKEFTRWYGESVLYKKSLLVKKLYENSSYEVKKHVVKTCFPKFNESLNIYTNTPTGQHIYNHVGYTKYQNIFLSVKVQKICNSLMSYSSDKLKYDDKITFFHGQGWSWNLQATVAKKLYAKTNNTTVGDDFTFLRFSKEDPGCCEEHQKELAQNGVNNKSRILFDEQRPNVLFANLALFANDSGSNTVDYVSYNNDQSIIQGRNIKNLIDVFTAFGFEEEIKQLQSQEPGLLNRWLWAGSGPLNELEQLHRSASEYGNFVTITMPRQLASEISYPTRSGGSRFEYEGMSDVSDIVDNFGKMPFRNEYCIALGPNMLDPIEAQKVGIEIKSWNSADPKIIAERDALIDEIIELCIAIKAAK